MSDENENELNPTELARAVDEALGVKTKLNRGKCVFCRGVIVEKLVRKYNPSTGPLIIGPGSEQQFVEVSCGFHCQHCGLKYEFVPLIF